MKRVLVIEDDKSILQGIVDNLKNERFEVSAEMDGERGYEIAKQKKFDVILLDVMLPNMDGLEICKRLRAEGVEVPILMLTAKGEELDKVLGLELGADDYVTKPFSVRELIARIRALLRRQMEIHTELGEARFGDVYIDFKKQEAVKGKKKLKMSAHEFQLLKYLAEREGEVVSRYQLLDDVWGYEVDITTRTVDNYILSLRKKLEDNPSKPKHIVTVHTVGYKFLR